MKSIFIVLSPGHFGDVIQIAQLILLQPTSNMALRTHKLCPQQYFCWPACAHDISPPVQASYEVVGCAEP